MITIPPTNQKSCHAHNFEKHFMFVFGYFFVGTKNELKYLSSNSTS